MFLGIAVYVTLSLQHLKIKSVGARSVEPIAEELVERKLLPSISYAVIEKGKIVSTKTFGIADIETGDIVNSQTLYEAASLTKPLVAEIARGLYDNGVFELDEKVADTFSNARIEDDPKWRLLTPRHLLSHTSGLPNWSGDSRDSSRENRLRFEFEPGSEFQYSGEGYGILLAFLEAKANQSAEVLADEFFKKLGMTNSTISAQTFEGQYARGHWARSPDRQGWKTSTPVAAYSLFTNAGDYGLFLKYVIELHSAEIKSNDPFTEIQTEFEFASSGESLGWSLGWGTLQRVNDIVYFQWGDNGAFRSFAAFEPVTRNGIVYFTNGSFGTIYADELAAPVLGDIATASSWFSGATKEIIRTWVKF